MALKSVLVLLCLAAVSQATFCPIFACSDVLGANVCVNSVTSDAYQINSNGCPSGYACYGAGIYSWAKALTATSYPTYDCQPAGTYYAIDPNTWTYATCYPKQENRQFKSRQAVVTCNRDIDCQLLDGSYSTCECVFRTDGAGVCKPDVSNELVYAGYWDECGTDMRINKQEIYAYWSTYMTYYTMLQSNVPCLDVIYEIGYVAQLQATYESAFHLLLGGLALLY